MSVSTTTRRANTLTSTTRRSSLFVIAFHMPTILLTTSDYLELSRTRKNAMPSQRERLRLSVVALSKVILVGSIRGAWPTPLASPGEKGQDGGAGAEQGQGEEDKAAEKGNPQRRGDQDGSDRRSQDVACPVAAGGEHDLTPQKIRCYEQPEEQKRKISRHE